MPYNYVQVRGKSKGIFSTDGQWYFLSPTKHMHSICMHKYNIMHSVVSNYNIWTGHCTVYTLPDYSLLDRDSVLNAALKTATLHVLGGLLTGLFLGPSAHSRVAELVRPSVLGSPLQLQFYLSLL